MIVVSEAVFGISHVSIAGFRLGFVGYNGNRRTWVAHVQFGNQKWSGSASSKEEAVELLVATAQLWVDQIKVILDII